MSTTRYVTWSLHTKSRASLKAMLSRVRAAPAHAILASPEYGGDASVVRVASALT
jgi:hypothetical protein